MEDPTVAKPGSTGEGASAPADLLGRTLLQFRVIERLGQGGMGVVYRAFDDKLRRPVALKVLNARYVVDDRNKAMILREARSAAAVVHPNVAAIYDVHEADGIVLLAMELVEGETLRARVAAGRLPIDDALRIAREIAAGLAKAHELGVVHRDLKPENVMLARTGHVKLLDFGIARAAGDVEPAPVASPELAYAVTAAATSTDGRIVGTPAYMAPEQARGEAVDARADVFALGVVLYELLAGQPPFGHRAGLPAAWSEADWQVVPLRRRGARVPVALDHVVMRCLAGRPADRYGHAGEVADALARIRPRRTRGAAALAVATALVVAGGALAWARHASAADCSDADAEVAAVWTPQAQVAYIARTGPERFGLEPAWLGRYADGLASALRARCAADPADAPDGECLARGVASLRAALARPDTDLRFWPMLVPLDQCAPHAPRLQATPVGVTGGVARLSPDATRFVVAASDHPTEVVDLHGTVQIALPDCLPRSDAFSRFLDDGTVACWVEGGIATFDASTGRRVRTIPIRGDVATDMSRDGRAAVLYGKGVELIEDTAHPDIQIPLAFDPKRVVQLELSPHARWLGVLEATASVTTVTIVDVHTRATRSWWPALRAWGRISRIIWLDDHTLLTGGTGHSDRTGDTLWRVELADDGSLAQAFPILPGRDRDYFDADDVAGNHILLERTILTQDIAEVRSGNRTLAPPFDARKGDLLAVVGNKALIRRGGVVVIAGLPGWTPVATIDLHARGLDRLMSASLRGDRLVGIVNTASGPRYFELDGDSVASAPVALHEPADENDLLNSILHCSGARCIVAQYGDPVLAEVGLDGMKPAVTYGPATAGNMWNWAIEGDDLVMADDGRLRYGQIGDARMRELELDECSHVSRLAFAGPRRVLLTCSHRDRGGILLEELDLDAPEHRHTLRESADFIRSIGGGPDGAIIDTVAKETRVELVEQETIARSAHDEH